MRIAYFSGQIPYPPTHGGKVDDWRRLNAMKAAGAEIHLVTWCSDQEDLQPTPEHLRALRSVAEVVHVWPILRTFEERLRRLSRLPSWPSHVASRIPNRIQRKTLETSLNEFKPDAVWLDGLYPWVIANEIAQQRGLHLFYRSHNIEHVYMGLQVKRATTFRDKLAWGLNLPHLEKAERNAIGKAHTFFDISTDDLSFWRAQGHKHGQWLPPLIEPGFAGRLAAPREAPPEFDVGYLGNLFAPNNVEGVLWFLNQVVPLVLAQKPQARFFIAGTNPVESIEAAIKQTPAVTLIRNAPDAVPVLRNAHVLVNPVFVGSGVNVKSVEMLFSPAQIVATQQGTAGLPDHVKDCFLQSDTPEGFAQAIGQALAVAQDPQANANTLLQRQAARNEFDFKRIAKVLDIIRQAGKPKVTD